jgi:hypothetical protein
MPGSALRTMVYAAAALLPALAAAAEERPKTGTRVSPGASTRVFVMAGFDANCQSLPKPQITVTVPPAKGAVSFRDGQTTTIQYSLSGKCIGAKVQGTGIYYTANANAEGPDTFSVEARMPTGEVASRTFKLNISD